MSLPTILWFTHITNACTRKRSSTLSKAPQKMCYLSRSHPGLPRGRDMLSCMQQPSFTAELLPKQIRCPVVGSGDCTPPTITEDTSPGDDLAMSSQPDVNPGVVQLLRTTRSGSMAASMAPSSVPQSSESKYGRVAISSARVQPKDVSNAFARFHSPWICVGNSADI